MITFQSYKALFPNAPEVYIEYLNSAMARSGVSNVNRRATFLSLTSVHTNLFYSFDKGALPTNPNMLHLYNARLSMDITPEMAKDPKYAILLASCLWEDSMGNDLCDKGLSSLLTKDILGTTYIDQVRKERERVKYVVSKQF